MRTVKFMGHEVGAPEVASGGLFACTWLFAAELGSLRIIFRLPLFLCWCLIASISVEAATAKRVLILHSYGRNYIPFSIVSCTFETELAKQSKFPIEFHEVALEGAQFAASESDQPTVSYLHTLFQGGAPDLIVSVGGPAARCALRLRPQLFPSTPLLLAALEARHMNSFALDTNTTAVASHFDFPALMDHLRGVWPGTTNVAVVLGGSALEHFWKAELQREWSNLTNRLGFMWFDHFSLSEIQDRMSRLPPHTVIFYIALLVDAAGVPYEYDHAIGAIHQTANAPMVGLFEEELGLGIVGGPLLNLRELASETAHVAIRMLNGERPGNIHTPTATTKTPMYDSRELQRWNISEARLPQGSAIRFRQPSIWARYGSWILAGASLFAIQGVLIGTLMGNLVKRRKAERSLRETDERMKLAAGAAGMCLWEVDFATDRVWVSGPLAERVRYNKGHEDFVQLFQGIHPDDQNRVAAALIKARMGKGDFESIHRRVLPDGKIMWLVARGRVEFDYAQKPLRMRGISMDITARKEAEERARESEGRFLVMANSAPVIMWATGLDKLCTFCNQAWLDLTGRPLEVQLGRGWAESIHPEDRANCIKTYLDAFDSRQPFTQQYRVRRHDGQYRWISDHGVPRYDAHQNFLGFIGSGMDITEQKRAEEEALRMREELAHVSRVSTLAELGGALAHELNQPLTAILSNAQAAARFLDSGNAGIGELREILNDIVQEDRRAGEVIVRMRAMLKKEDARMALEDVNEIVREVLSLLRSELLIRKVTITTDLAPRLLPVIGDRVRLQQVLLNLVVNACDAMVDVPQAERQITIRTEEAGDGLVHVSVTDRGSGFPPSDSDEMFQAFRTTKPNGLGLGLIICRSIVESHGGRLSVNNNVEGGATVRFSLKTHNVGTIHAKSAETL